MSGNTKLRVTRNEASQRDWAVAFLGTDRGSWRRGALLLSALALFPACGGPEPGERLPGTGDEPSGTGGRTSEEISGPGESGVPYQVVGLCEITALPKVELQPIDKEKFVEVLGDSTVNWMKLLHEALTLVDEESMFEAMVETVRGSYDTSCRSESTNFDISPPDELIGPDTQMHVRQDLIELFAEAEVVSSGEVLRLSLHECEACSEPIGETPVFVDVRWAKDGALLLEIQLREGEPWTRTVRIASDEIAVRVELEPLADFLKTATSKARSGETVPPVLSGSVVFGARKEDDGTTRGWIGLSRMAAVTDPGLEKEAHFTSHSDCVGLELTFGQKKDGSRAALDIDDLDISVAGSTYCSSSSNCSEEERAGSFEHTLRGASVVLEDPPSDASEDVRVRLETADETTSSVNGAVFARGGLGKQGKGGSFDLTAEKGEEGFLVTFLPALDLGGAMVISSFSEKLRLALPDWLNDEIFDLSFGGAAVPSIRVPLREVCNVSTILRREVEIVSGSGTLSVGDGRVLEASAGECVGRSLSDSSTFDLISDFWEAGFVCSE